MVYLSRLSFSVLLVAFLGCICQGAETLLWELPAGAKPTELAGKTAWTKATAGSAAANGLAVENTLLVLCAKPGDAGLVLHGKGDPVDSAACSEVRCLDQGDQPVTVKTVKSSAANDGIQLEVGLSNGGVLTALLTPDASSVKFSFDAKIKTVRIFASMPVIFRPTFFDTGMVYHTSLSTFAQGASYVPVDNYVFGLLNANAALGCAWNSKKVKVQLTPSTTFVAPAAAAPVVPATPVAPIAPATPAAPKAPALIVTPVVIDKPFESLQITLDPADPILFAGIMKRPNAFIYQNLSGQTLDKKKGNLKYAEISLTWTPPYSAGWTAILLHGEQPNNAPSCKPVTRMWFLPAGENKDGTPIWNKYDGWEADKRIWNPKVLRGATFNGKDTVTWNVEERFLPYTAGFIVPLCRDKKTPPDAMTIVDFVREALGDKALDDVLDIPGLKTRTTVDGHPTPGASCGAMTEVCNMCNRIDGLPKGPDGQPTHPDLAKKKEEILNGLLGVRWYFDLLADRAQEYLSNAEKLDKFATEHAADSPNCKPLADAVKAACAEIKGEYVAESGKENTSTRQWQDAFWDKTIETTKEWKFPIAGYMNQQRNPQVATGDAIDSFVSKACKDLKRATWAAYLLGGKDEASLTMAQNIISMCHQYLRNRHSVEDRAYLVHAEAHPTRLPAKK